MVFYRFHLLRRIFIALTTADVRYTFTVFFDTRGCGGTELSGIDCEFVLHYKEYTSKVSEVQSRCGSAIGHWPTSNVMFYRWSESP